MTIELVFAPGNTARSRYLARARSNPNPAVALLPDYTPAPGLSP
jgi:hypothetical protein